jgi:hypothetical protein
MAFDHFVDVVKEHPEEAIQLATTVVGVVLTALGFAAGGGWWAANTLAKAKLELLQERRDFARQREEALRETVNTLKAELASQPASISATETAQDVDQALTEFEGARKAVGDAYSGLEYVVGSIWNGLAEIISGAPDSKDPARKDRPNGPDRPPEPA